jgi:hypothetical protein
MDDWEDEDDEFAVNPPRAFKAPVSSAESWEDEDEVEVVVKSAAPSAAQLEATAKKIAEEEIRMANVLKFAILEDETPDEKRARERKQIEEADADLAGELFGGGKSGGTTSKAAPSFSSGVAAVTVKSKADHTSFGILCAKKLSDSNSFNVAAFYKSFTEKIQKNMTTESCDEILAILQKVQKETLEMALNFSNVLYATSAGIFLGFIVPNYVAQIKIRITKFEKNQTI